MHTKKYYQKVQKNMRDRKKYTIEKCFKINSLVESI